MWQNLTEDNPIWMEEAQVKQPQINWTTMEINVFTFPCYTWESIYIIQSLHAGTLPVTPPRSRDWTLRKLLWRKLVTLMLSCSGRNDNFWCINVVFGVFLRETARTTAIGRTNLSTHSGKATKRLARLAPKLADSSGNGHRLNTIRATIPQGAFGDGGGGGLGGHKFKSLGKLWNGWADWHQIWYMSADSSGNGHMLNTIRRSIPQRAFWGF